MPAWQRPVYFRVGTPDPAFERQRPFTVAAPSESRAGDDYSLVREAVLGREQVRGWYGGYYRELSPHALGTKRGEPHGLFYQFGGDSGSGLHEPGSPRNFRCMRIGRLLVVETRRGDWHTAPIEGEQHTCIDKLDVVAPSVGSEEGKPAVA